MLFGTVQMDAFAAGQSTGGSTAVVSEQGTAGDMNVAGDPATQSDEGVSVQSLAAYTLTVTADTEAGKAAVEKTQFYINGADPNKITPTVGSAIDIVKNTNTKMQFRIQTPETMSGVCGLEVIIDGVSVKKMNTIENDEITTSEVPLGSDGIFSHITIKEASNNPEKFYLYFDNTNNQMTSLMSEKNVIIKFIFERGVSADYNLDVTAGEGVRKVYDVKWVKNVEDGSLYGVYVRPEDGYQLVSYTMDGKENPIALKNDDYTSWTDENNKRYTCNYFEVTVTKDSDIKLNFAPAEMEFKLIGYQPIESNVAMYQFSGGNSDYDTSYKDIGVSTMPLLENTGVKFYFHLQTKGYLWFDQNGKQSQYEGFKIYAGEEKTEANLLFDMNTSGAACNDNNLGMPNETYFNESDAKKGYVLSGAATRIGSVILVSTPELTKVTLEAQAYGETYTTTADVQMASDLPEVKALSTYYTDTYGLDKTGLTAYTAEEKATDAYKKYCQYSNFRYVLRKVYQKQLLKIGSAAEDKRAEALVDAKAALDAAARGEGCNAVVWNFQDKDGTSSIPVMVAIPNNGTTSASDSMEAALEALYPGNWTYNCTATSFGAFVNSITAGNDTDTGSINIQIRPDGSTGGSYGFWFYNGKFSDWGVSNYFPYDGDVMWWGGGNVDKNWNWALLRLKYGDDELAKELVKRGATKSVEQLAASELASLFPEIDFKRYGQFREVTAAELVEIQIGQIGTVTPDSGDDIKAARNAYDALTSEQQKKVRNVEILANAENAYKKLLEKSSVAYTDAMNKTLTGLSTTTLGVGSTKGEWAIISLARRGLISGSDASGQAAVYIAAAMDALEAGKLSSSTDYARVTLALSSLGVSAPEAMIKQCEDYDKAVEQGVNAVAYALLALDAKPYDTANKEIREKYVSYLLTHCCKDGGWVLGDDLTVTADTDVTAMVIQALAPYYKENRADVKAAVDKALDALKGMQKVTGGFASYGTYNAESTAQVIVALCSIGIDPTTWNEKDVVDALLHFYVTADGKNGFSHTLGDAMDQMATEQSAYALVAYSRFAQGKSSLYDMKDAFGNSGSAVNPVQAVASAAMAVATMGEQSVSMAVANTEEAVLNYVKTSVLLLGIDGPTYTVKIKEGDSGKLFVAAAAGTESNQAGTAGSFCVDVTISMDGAQAVTKTVTGVITPTAYVAPKPDVTVSFALYGDTKHAVKSDSDLHTYRFNVADLSKWVETVEVTVPGDATVGDVFKKVLDEKGFTYVGLEDGYISSITSPDGVTLTAKDNTDASGWMYMVNGSYPNVGLTSKTVAGGDVIIWHWTDEYRLEQSSMEYNPGMAVSYVEKLIDTIGTVTLQSEPQIKQARFAYDLLSDEEQKDVDNYVKLTAAEEKFKALQEAGDTDKPGTDDTDPTDAVIRISGTTRYETSIKIAEELKANLGIEKFDTVILTTGMKFADALSGSSLASAVNAPILLIDAKKVDVVSAYVRENLREGGKIYVLGGAAAVPESALASLTGYDICRLAGATRYETNLAILKEMKARGISMDKIAICTGENFADSLSIAATNLPILIVGETFTNEQRAFLSNSGCESCYLIGGTAAVSAKIENAAKTLTKTERIYGKTRLETSVAVAETFFQNAESVMIAAAIDFPDALCGGPLAVRRGCPMLLCAEGQEQVAKSYISTHEIKKGKILGGEKAVSEQSVKTLFE